MKSAYICSGLLLAASTQVFAAGSGGHADPVAAILLALIVILAVAKLSSEIFERLGQPAVLGELLGGVLLGNLILFNPDWSFFEPFFFVLMGIQVRLETFTDLSVLGVAAGLTIAAIIGKQICGLGVLEKGLDRITVGIGMIPRGEVGLIFAGIGKSLKVIDDATFSAVVIMVIVTTLITPPILKFALAR
jgi:Kef-type K+ transport system membrane component KefB